MRNIYIRKEFGPFRFWVGTTSWREKTVAIGFGKGFYSKYQEWVYFVAVNLYFVYINFGIKAWWDREDDGE